MKGTSRYTDRMKASLNIANKSLPPKAVRRAAVLYNYTPTLCNNAELRKATRHIGQLFDDVVEPRGLRAAQHALLAQIRSMERPTMKELATALVMDLSALGHTLEPLSRDGYVRLTLNDQDRRSKRVSLTPAGTAKLRRSSRLWQAAQMRFEKAMGCERARELRETLSLVASERFGEAFRRSRTLRR